MAVIKTKSLSDHTRNKLKQSGKKDYEYQKYK